MKKISSEKLNLHGDPLHHGKLFRNVKMICRPGIHLETLPDLWEKKPLWKTESKLGSHFFLVFLILNIFALLHGSLNVKFSSTNNHTFPNALALNAF